MFSVILTSFVIYLFLNYIQTVTDIATVSVHTSAPRNSQSNSNDNSGPQLGRTEELPLENESFVLNLKNA